jgi:hypothetical protein
MSYVVLLRGCMPEILCRAKRSSIITTATERQFAVAQAHYVPSVACADWMLGVDEKGGH